MLTSYICSAMEKPECHIDVNIKFYIILSHIDLHEQNAFSIEKHCITWRPSLCLCFLLLFHPPLSLPFLLHALPFFPSPPLLLLLLSFYLLFLCIGNWTQRLYTGYTLNTFYFISLSWCHDNLLNCTCWAQISLNIPKCWTHRHARHIYASVTTSTNP